MSVISKPYTFSAGATIIASEHNSNFDTIYNEFNGNITNSNIASGAAIVDTKLAQITTASKVSGAAITSLSSLPSGAGVVPIANLATGTPDGTKFIRDDGTLQLPFTAASQAQMETATSNVVAVTPLSTNWHPGVAKAWICFNGTGTPAVRVSHNFDSSITDHGTGDYTVSMTTDFSSSNYAVAGFSINTASGDSLVAGVTTPAAGSLRINVWSTATVAKDPEYCSIIMFGDQA